MKLAIIDYGAGNLFSVANACRNMNYDPVLSSDPEIISSADKIIFPGVGNAISAMKNIREKGLDSLIPGLKKPVLGICLGMQLLFESSDEGNTEALGVLPGKVTDFRSAGDPGIKVPHMGWNIIDNLRGDLFRGTEEGSYLYFVHSYYVPDNGYTIANSYYNGTFSAAIQKDNFFGCQFHPEKSGETGLRILKNFLDI